MCCRHNVVQTDETFSHLGLEFIDVKGGPGDFPFLERLHQIGFVDDRAPGSIDEIGRFSHLFEFGGTEQMPCLGQ